MRSRGPHHCLQFGDIVLLAAGRVYAAYGGVYVGVAILWLRLADGQRPGARDAVGAAVAIAGMAIIMFAPGSS